MGPLGPPRAPKMKVLRPGRYSNGFLTQFCSGLVVSDPKSDHPDPFWLIIRQKTDFLYLFQVLLIVQEASTFSFLTKLQFPDSRLKNCKEKVEI